MSKLKCPKCKKTVDFAGQIEQWSKEYGKEANWLGMLVIVCDNCAEFIRGVFIEKVKGTEEVYSPALKQKVKIPKF